MIDILLSIPYIEPTLVILSLSGALLVGLSDPKYRNMGFTIWIITNIFWICLNFGKTEYWLATQFSGFLVFAIIGYHTTRPDKGEIPLK